MSWIIGGLSKTDKLEKIKKIPFLPTIQHEQKNLSVYGAGKSLISFTASDQKLYIICGSGINEKYELMNENNWKEHFRLKKTSSKLNGHYLIIKIYKNEIEIINDQLGLRELFFYDNGKEIYFSSRLDWIIEFIDSIKLNYNYLCSLWNLENPIIYESLIENVKILGPGGNAKISKDGLNIINQPWFPEMRDYSLEDVIHIISKIINSLIDKGKNLCLGLSGGIDSRTILSLLSGYDLNLWSTHTFGQKTNFDVKIANAISKVKKFKHHHYDIAPYSNDKIFGTWMDFVQETNCLIPANFYHELSYYKVLPQNELFIDGGKGEYIRRGLSNRLSILGKKALLSKNIEKIRKFLYLRKPNIFSKDIINNWDSLLNKQVSDLMNNMPNVSDLGIENWVDLYNIRYRTGNSSYPSQTRLDCIVQNLMPLIQPAVLNGVLNLPHNLRAKEIINKKILNKNILLKLFPLARYQTIIPFQYNKFSRLLWGKIMKYFIKESSENLHLFLNLNKDYIFSRLSDIDFINSPVYDRNKIEVSIRDYYKGLKINANFIVWWMTFDQWHKLIFRK